MRLLSRVRSVRAVVTVGLGSLALAWATYLYWSHVDSRASRGEAPHDLEVFLAAAGRVLDGASPYAFHADQTYAYPPLLAYVVAPLHPLSVGAATAVWTVLSLAAVAASLWLLGVRDWRCYCLTALYPTTRSAVDLGTVGPLLLLAAAAAWRWRERVVRSAGALAVAVVLKLFLWPLAIWPALLRRRPTALVTASFAVALALVPWAAIGFEGLGDYPGLLRHLADDEAGASYSVYALGVRVKLPDAVATIVSLLVAAVFLLLAWYVARDRLRTPRDREAASLTLVLAAALAASPIVWMHYFLLLLVPLALTRPRLSPLWLVPFAYYPLGETAWPGGDPKKLGLAVVTTLVLLGASVKRGAGDERVGQRDRAPGAAAVPRLPSVMSRVPPPETKPG